MQNHNDFDRKLSKEVLHLALTNIATAGINKLTFGKSSEILGKENVEMPITAIFKSNVLHGTTDFIMLLVLVWSITVFLIKLALEMEKLENKYIF